MPVCLQQGVYLVGEVVFERVVYTSLYSENAFQLLPFQLLPDVARYKVTEYTRITYR